MDKKKLPEINGTETEVATFAMPTQSELQFAINVLEQHIEHPTKPGYKRSDIVKRIKSLKKQLEENICF